MTASEERARNLRYFHQPELWPLWPWLPVVRRSRGKEELGVLCDLKNLHGLTGYSATVFYANLFALPDSVGAFLALPREVHDTPEEVYEAGGVWIKSQ